MSKPFRMTPERQARAVRACNEWLKQLGRTPTPEERRQAAIALGIEDYLPDPEPQLFEQERAA